MDDLFMQQEYVSLQQNPDPQRDTSQRLAIPLVHTFFHKLHKTEAKWLQVM
jgi:hypothetical protein